MFLLPFFQNLRPTAERLLGMACLIALMSPGVGAAPDASATGELQRNMQRHHVVWTTPGKDSSDSMPLGNGDIALNAWVDEAGDLQFYIAKSDAWSGNGRLLKLGKIRITPTNRFYSDKVAFRQELDLWNGEMAVNPGGRPSLVSSARVWVDAHHPVIHVEVTSFRSIKLRAELEVWRDVPRTITNADEKQSAYGLANGPDPIVVAPDTIRPARDHRIVWFHRNETSIYAETLRRQGLTELIDEFDDPLMGLTFGAMMTGDGMEAVSNTALESAEPGKQFRIDIYPLTTQTTTEREWEDRLTQSVQAVKGTEIETARTAHRQWWNAFWQRSWIFADTPLAVIRDEKVGLGSNDLPIRLGADSEGQNRFMGRMARVSLFDRALTTAEIRALALADRHQRLSPRRDLVGRYYPGTLQEGYVNNEGVPNDHVQPSLRAKAIGPIRPQADKEADSNPFGVALFDGSGYLEIENSAGLAFSNGLTIEAWIAPDRFPASGMRLVDKCPVGTANGFTFDTYPGQALRSITPGETLQTKLNVKAGEWMHVAMTYDARNNRHSIYYNGVAVSGEPVEGESVLNAGPSPVTLGYTLQRYLNACAGRGAWPIKFNGSLFTVDTRGYAPNLGPDARAGEDWFDADYRRWGGPYWFQNTRLPYWSMLAAGDDDLMTPFFAMYRNLLPFGQRRTQIYHGHDGAFFPETIYFWGAYATDNYGWERPEDLPVWKTTNTYIRYYWSSGIEMTLMALEVFAQTGDGAFARETLVPLAENVIRFYDRHYRDKDEKGRRLITPAMALETWKEAVNPTPVVAGLRYLIDRLLAELPDGIASEDLRAEWKAFRKELPELPTTETDGVRRLLPAQQFEGLQNSENPELYAIFPYRIFGLGKPDLDMARGAFEARRVKRTGGWSQDPIQAALLGLANAAARDVHKNFSTSHGPSRFPAFWGPNFDWVPDQDHGGVAMTALQKMLLQCDGDQIRVLPAWPRKWDVDFKLHAPGLTTVHCVWKDEKLLTLEVDPPARKKDVLFHEPRE